ncbi:dihydrofolate reductase-like protein [Elsinoe australis]|uniref:Dihydrofolate reductase n=1 Tax=Elsinoe australis TaxID=40998 RepID=A0A4U7BC09_9PEZI|nr:dihydrofolate reductase-like protein [Elsinoe australis]
MSQPPLTLIVAATTKNGIGKAGGLPWPMLKKEMAHFARVTKRVPSSMTASSNSSKPVQNVVIMGRKTWDSIPQKLRPLKERTNIIITRQAPDSLATSHEDVIVASSIEDGISQLASKEAGLSKTPGRYYIIGGSSIYEAALKLPHQKSILLTRIHEEYDCDTFFPIDLELDQAKQQGWQKKSNAELSDFVEEEVQDDDMEETVKGETVRYRLHLYGQS